MKTQSRIRVSFTLLMILAASAAHAEAVNTCLSCHQEIELMPADFFEDDIHQQAGLSCAGCHGGNPLEEDMDLSMSREASYVGVPSKKELPQFCGKCHDDIEFMRVYQPRISTDQVEQYYSSRHGELLRQGNQNVAQCVSCHSAHKILPAKDPRSSVYAVNIPATCNTCHGNEEIMRHTNHGTNQLADYARSVHGRALLEKKDTGAPACNDCHGNHGAAPPGASSVAHVCGTCHLKNMEYFLESKMGESLVEDDYHSCEQCHSNHAILAPDVEYLNVGLESPCLECHTEGDEGFSASLSMYHDLTATDSLLIVAQDRLHDIKIKGMNDVEINFLLQEARQNKIQLRTLVHTFDPARVARQAFMADSLSEKAILLAAEEIRKFDMRRLGFGLATLAFVLLAIAVYLRIREIDTRRLEH